MGRTVLAEESLKDDVDNMFGNVQWQIGLIIGQVGTKNAIKAATEYANLVYLSYNF